MHITTEFWLFSPLASNWDKEQSSMRPEILILGIDGYRVVKPILSTTFLTNLYSICEIRCRKRCHWNFSVIQVKKKEDIHLDFLFQICFTSYPGGFISSKLTSGNACLLNTVLGYLMLSLVVVGGHLHYWKGVSVMCWMIMKLSVEGSQNSIVSVWQLAL